MYNIYIFLENEVPKTKKCVHRELITTALDMTLLLNGF